MKVKLALAQINTRLGVVEKNLETHLAQIEKAVGEGSDLVIFPELSLTGYVLQDLASTVARKPSVDDPVFKELLSASKTIDIVAGFVEEDERNRFYISSAYLSLGKVAHVHRLWSV
jgi:NAD+ synthase (glutamine-hydrolysing)